MEARLIHGYVWRQLLDSIKDLVVRRFFFLVFVLTRLHVHGIG